MSYILDALKKSEQERERGDVPSLQSNHMAPTVEIERKSWKSWGLWGVVVLNVIALVFWLGRAGVSPENSVRPNTSSHLNVALTGNVEPTGSVEPREHIEPTGKATPLGKRADPSGVTSDVDKVSPYSNELKAVSLLKDNVEMKSRLASENDLKLKDKAKTEKEERKKLAISEETSETDTFKEDLVTLKKQSEKVNLVTEERESVMNLSQLPAHIRDNIPQLEFSSHLYSGMPQYRNVIINGMNLKEQQPLDRDIFLERITKNGVVLTYQGYTFEVGVIQQWNF
ncbi:MAG: general secretion pathway protein GspB [Pseudomonadales bacterium]|nr:general secretion pathway protein GspB [Pseudomonadales bacterium]